MSTNDDNPYRPPQTMPEAEPESASLQDSATETRWPADIEMASPEAILLIGIVSGAAVVDPLGLSAHWAPYAAGIGAMLALGVWTAFRWRVRDHA